MHLEKTNNSLNSATWFQVFLLRLCHHSLIRAPLTQLNICYDHNVLSKVIQPENRCLVTNYLSKTYTCYSSHLACSTWFDS